MDKLRGMETFIAVVESGSFTSAATRLEMSAVMVGKYITQLEAQLGTRLLERNTRRQSLTDAGRVYFEEARRVLEQVSIAERSVERLRLAPAGRRCALARLLLLALALSRRWPLRFYRPGQRCALSWI